MRDVCVHLQSPAAGQARTFLFFFLFLSFQEPPVQKCWAHLENLNPGLKLSANIWTQACDTPKHDAGVRRWRHGLWAAVASRLALLISFRAPVCVTCQTFSSACVIAYFAPSFYSNELNLGREMDVQQQAGKPCWLERAPRRGILFPLLFATFSCGRWPSCVKGWTKLGLTRNLILYS